MAGTKKCNSGSISSIDNGDSTGDTLTWRSCMVALSYYVYDDNNSGGLNYEMLQNHGSQNKDASEKLCLPVSSPHDALRKTGKKGS